MHHRSRTWRLREEAAVRAGMRPRRRQVWTYLVEMPEVGMLKIGVSVNPRARVTCMTVPFAVKLVAQLPGDREDEFHARFKKHRVRSEWFRDVRSIRSAFSEGRV